MMVVIVEFALRAGAETEFEIMLKHMQQRVKQYDGYLGEAPCCRIDNEKIFVTLFYWQEDSEHVEVQRLGREKLFAWYKIRVCELERDYWGEYSE